MNVILLLLAELVKCNCELAFPPASEALSANFTKFATACLPATSPYEAPPLIAHTPFDESHEQIVQHDSAVELGTALVLLVLQNLISRSATNFVFTETLSCR